jgi:hypothetical protein
MDVNGTKHISQKCNAAFSNLLLVYLMTVSVAQEYVTLNDKIVVNNELEGVWMEMLMACFEVLFQHLLGRTRKNLRIATLSVKILTREFPHIV